VLYRDVMVQECVLFKNGCSIGIFAVWECMQSRNACSLERLQYSNICSLGMCAVLE